MALHSEARLIDYAKQQLTAGKRVPYSFTAYGALAARSLFREGIHIPKKIVPPTPKEEYEYTLIYNQKENINHQLKKQIKQLRTKAIAMIREITNLALLPQQAEKSQLPAG